MLGLGKVVKTPSDSVIINVYTFNMEKLTWSLIPVRAKFQVASIHFGEGGFRRAYRATTILAKTNETSSLINNLIYSSPLPMLIKMSKKPTHSALCHR